MQQAVRFGLFHTLQAGARAEQRPIGSKGLTGPGYDGHTFWDAETFVLPVLTYTQPAAAADVLRWRHSTLDLARERAQTLGLQGAAFPWRTIRGQECSAYWPAGTAGFHIGADIADAVRRYVQATGDVDFEREIGLELLVETARLWRSLGHHDRHGRFHIDGVTGPDEYTAVVDDNIYTNLMAQQNLFAAAEAAKRHPDAGPQAGRGRRGDGVLAGRGGGRAHPVRPGARRAPAVARASPGCRSGTSRTRRRRRTRCCCNYPYFDLYRKQVVKQADLVMAMYVRGDAFTPEREGAQLRVLRRAHRARLVAVGVHPGRHGRRGGPPRAGPRLPRARPP